ncbi:MULTISPECIES: LysR family transcriptional regulator [unclassified Mesorhizobium]|uniref:LysR family transcriptional regulator n=1 Tax=unclassified Mesorhizobium TaxID=325217 RepID=UPI00112605CF|nr:MULTISPECIES: LysR family transcriptional regulator [unclassified Mesorhizobium]TPL00760.1 LysR family transcriptional regulator [Mesorhizobium sp. B2-4-16]TPL76979.1 LysR family transcriptional regulator [Mesorhizobium sp. B2-4-3]
MDWDDIRVFLELARTGTLTEAGRRLNVNHTTISRRIRRLELSIGENLFIRSGSGYSMSERGTLLHDEALAIEELFFGLADSSSGAEEAIEGRVRIGCPEGFGIGVMPKLLPQIGEAFPDLLVDLLVQPRRISLARHEADIVITIDRPERGPYLITKLFDYDLRLYASPEYLAKRPQISSLSDLRGHRVIGYVEEGSPGKDLPALTELNDAADANFRSTSIFSQIAAVSSGAGIAILPEYLLGDSGVVPILGQTVKFKRTYWMLMPTELKRIARIRAIWYFLRRKARPPRLTSGSRR